MHRREAEASTAALDPQNLNLRQKVSALLNLGRIPLASEVPLWCMFGCILSSQIFPIYSSANGKSPNPNTGPFAHFDFWATLQCMLVVWGTNLSINYGNEYFDYDMDRPGMVAAIKRDLKARKKLEEKKQEIKEKVADGEPMDEEEEEIFEVDARANQENDKIMGSTTRIIHDGTFPPLTALLCSIFVQVLLILLITLSRHYDDYAPSTSASTSLLPNHARRVSPFRGVALNIGLVCTFLSQTYVGPPLRLHYNGFGELVSALLLSPVSVLFGLIGHHTAVSGIPLSSSDFFANIGLREQVLKLGRGIAATGKLATGSGFTIDRQLLTLLFAFYFYEQARIFIMHIQDIDADRRGGKITLAVRLGFTRTRQLYVALNIIAVSLFAVLARQFALVVLYGPTVLKTSSIVPNSTIVSFQHGMLYRLGGANPTDSVVRTRAITWLTGILLIMCYALPIMAITAKSLFVADPSRVSASAKPNANVKVANKANEESTSIGISQNQNGSGSEANLRQRSSATKTQTQSQTPSAKLGASAGGLSSIFDFIPVLPHQDLAMIVSLQMLLTPAVLSITLVIGSLVASRGSA
jgi:1,4-dihydroxy-2-naphthoate octaprenyltransferase